MWQTNSAQQQAALDAAQNEYESALADGIVPGAIQQDVPVPGDAFDPNDPSTWPYGVEWNPVNPEFSPDNFWNNSGDPTQLGPALALIGGDSDDKSDQEEGVTFWDAVAKGIKSTLDYYGIPTPSLGLGTLAPSQSPVWSGYNRTGRAGIRTAGTGNNKQYYEWDSTHGHIETYDRNGNHLGVTDPVTGVLDETKRVPGRDIKSKL